MVKSMAHSRKKQLHMTAFQRYKWFLHPIVQFMSVYGSNNILHRHLTYITCKYTNSCLRIVRFLISSNAIFNFQTNSATTKIATRTSPTIWTPPLPSLLASNRSLTAYQLFVFIKKIPKKSLATLVDLFIITISQINSSRAQVHNDIAVFTIWNWLPANQKPERFWTARDGDDEPTPDDFMRFVSFVRWNRTMRNSYLGHIFQLACGKWASSWFKFSNLLTLRFQFRARNYVWLAIDVWSRRDDYWRHRRSWIGCIFRQPFLPTIIYIEIPVFFKQWKLLPRSSLLQSYCEITNSLLHHR